MGKRDFVEEYSSVRECKTRARLLSERAGAESMMRKSMFWRDSSSANMRPVGPAPTMRTCVAGILFDENVCQDFLLSPRVQSAHLMECKRDLRDLCTDRGRIEKWWCTRRVELKPRGGSTFLSLMRR